MARYRSYLCMVQLFVMLPVLCCHSALSNDSVDPADACQVAARHYETQDVDNPKILNYFEEMAKKGDVRGTMWMARIYLMGRLSLRANPFKAQEMAKGVISDIIKLAEKGDREAQFLLGSAYQEGLAVTPNAEEAKKWLTKAAEAGQITAMNNLGNMMLHAQGFEPNMQKARALFTRAAILGSGRAAKSLETTSLEKPDNKRFNELRELPIVQVLGMTKANGFAFLKKAGLVTDTDDFILTSDASENIYHFKADGIILTIDYGDRVMNVEGHSAGSRESNPYRGRNPFDLGWGDDAQVLINKFGKPDDEGSPAGDDAYGMVYRINNLNFVGLFSTEGKKKLKAWRVFERWAVKYPPTETMTTEKH